MDQILKINIGKYEKAMFGLKNAISHAAIKNQQKFFQTIDQTLQKFPNELRQSSNLKP